MEQEGRGGGGHGGRQPRLALALARRGREEEDHRERLGRAEEGGVLKKTKVRCCFHFRLLASHFESGSSSSFEPSSSFVLRGQDRAKFKSGFLLNCGCMENSKSELLHVSFFDLVSVVRAIGCLAFQFLNFLNSEYESLYSRSLSLY